ncbi:MAG: DUF4258 domain-containing protein [Candidatus Micrarchaeota archaeon]|nr:DUF4258 domain-containing protein [Candidatus Micrarchaeota archaeon]MDE1834299.1 DUF4258 domain-containing protein [Candidatus Micrarchaeota archaeon]MDE1859440.1 DUF4258 domain-containing protein [Candidatus Micrarchaeota archaeon]
MKVELTTHAKERMRKYNVSSSLVMATMENPSSIMEGYNGRKIYQKKLNGHILRVVVEESKEIKASKVITVYKARSGRYD